MLSSFKSVKAKATEKREANEKNDRIKNDLNLVDIGAANELNGAGRVGETDIAPL